MKRKITAKLVSFGKKNALCKVLSIILLATYLFFYYIKEYFTHNTKRFISIAVMAIVFVASTSFAFEDNSPQDTVISEHSSQNEYSGENAADTAEDDVQPEAQRAEDKEDVTKILNDRDVMEGYENHDIEYVSEEYKFSVEEIIDENKEYAGVNSNSVSGNSYSRENLSKDDWRLVLINKNHSIPSDYTFTLGTIRGSMQCDERIIPELLEMLKAAKEDGVNLVICSPYRDLNRQKVLFNRKIKAYMKKGVSYLEAYHLTSQAVTVPGASEHQIGLAIDIISDRYSSLNEGFGDTEAGKWLAEHSCEYGFILRYPKGKEYITGIEYEPWHFRYVGKEAAAIITQEGTTLEEFWEDL